MFGNHSMLPTRTHTDTRSHTYGTTITMLLHISLSFYHSGDVLPEKIIITSYANEILTLLFHVVCYYLIIHTRVG